MIHADVLIAGRSEFFECELLQRQAAFQLRQRFLLDELLVLLQPRHVSVVEYRKTVRTHADHRIERALETRGRLMRQADDEVEIDAVEVLAAYPAVHFTNQCFRLHAVYGVLHLVVEILHAEAHAVEATLAQCSHMLAREFARIHLTADFGVRGNAEFAGKVIEQPTHILRPEVGGGTAAPMQLAHCALRRHEWRYPVDLKEQDIKVGLRLAVLLGGDHVAATVVAKRVAERDVNIQRDVTPPILGGA